MTSWKITLEHTNAEGLLNAVTVSSDWEESAGISDEMECIAVDLAKILCAFEMLGVTVPVEGEEVLAAFKDTFGQNYDYWLNKPTPSRT